LFRECLVEAGFTGVKVWWSEVRPDEESEFEEIVHTRPNQSHTWYAPLHPLFPFLYLHKKKKRKEKKKEKKKKKKEKKKRKEKNTTQHWWRGKRRKKKKKRGGIFC
jgi:hypothetical protein